MTTVNPTVTQAFLQTFLLRHSLTREQATALLARLLAIDNGSAAEDQEEAAEGNLDAYLKACNAKLVDLDFELKSTRDQTTGAPVYTFVNLSASESVKGGTSLAAVEVQFVKNVVELIFSDRSAATRDEEDGEGEAGGNGVRPYYITAKQATLEAYPKDSTGRVTLTRAQILDKLNGLVDLGWFDRFDPSTSSILTDDSSPGPGLGTGTGSNMVRYALSNRALSELGPYISDTFPRAPRCAACRELFTKGRVCRGCRPGAKMRVHEACLGPFVAMKGPRCGGCGQEWETTAYQLPF